jgi:hypothetical protein
MSDAVDVHNPNPKPKVPNPKPWTDAHRAKEAAKAELARLEQTIAEERKIRQKELAERRKLVQAKIEV